MLVNPLELKTVYRPKTLAEALTYLNQVPDPPHIIAGGTGLLQGSAPHVHAVLDISDLDLAYTTVDREYLRIGAGTSLQNVVEDERLGEFADGLLVSAARAVAPSIQRHQQTVGGTVAAGAGNDDFLVAALALEGEVVYYVPEERDTPHVCSLATFLAEVRAHPPYLITELRFPLHNQAARGRLERVSRTPRDQAIVNVAAVIAREGERIARACVAVGGVGPYPVHLEPVKSILQGVSYKQVDISQVEVVAREAVTPQDDWRASAVYRRHLVGVLARRAIQSLL